MNLEKMFRLQQKRKKGILPRIFKAIGNKEQLISEIQDNAKKNDFTSLFIVSRNREVFCQEFVISNDFRLNAISEIVNIMNAGEGDIGFQNEIINYLMQVRDGNFLIYVLDNLLYKEERFCTKNVQVFISTLSTGFKASKLDDDQKQMLQSTIYKHFSNVKTEIQEALLRMLEIIKIVDLYKTAGLFNDSEEPIRKKLLDVIKTNISYEEESATIDTLNLMMDEMVADKNNITIFIIALDKYESGKELFAMSELRKNSVAYEYVINRIRELMDEKVIDENKFSKLLQFA